MADPKLRFKRSSVPGKIPNETQVPLGEIALNTYDGKLFASKNVGIGTTVFVVNPWNVGAGTDTYNTFFNVGNVGVGTTNPTSKLQIQGDVNVSGVITASGGINAPLYVDESEDDNIYYNIPFLDTTGGGNTYRLMQVDDGGLQFNPGANVLAAVNIYTERITPNSGSTNLTLSNFALTGGITIRAVTGNVGVGTTNPTSRLQVQGDANVSGALTATNAINSLTDVQINGVSVLTTASNDAVALAIALG